MANDKVMNYDGLHKYRLNFEKPYDNPREASFVKTWKHWNRGGRQVNDNLIEILMTEYSENAKEGFVSCHNGFNNYHKPPNLSQETVRAVSTFVQWLGSNNGMGFLETALKDCGYKIIKE